MRAWPEPAVLSSQRSALLPGQGPPGPSERMKSMVSKELPTVSTTTSRVSGSVSWKTTSGAPPITEPHV
jgi:hypothetical protein